MTQGARGALHTSRHKEYTMPVIQGGPGRGRYLVTCADSGRLSRFVADARSNPELQLLDTVGPTGAPHTAVYEMAHDMAAQLQKHFAASGELNIEPDRPLSLFDSVPFDD